jgi:phage-related protein
MPRTMPAGAVAAFKRPGGFIPLLLLDVQTLDGTHYYFSDGDGTYPTVLGAGPTALYGPHILGIDGFNSNRSQRVDGGSIILQNLSGNPVVRDMASAFDAREFEGALTVLRFWKLEMAAASETWVGVLGEPQVDEPQVTIAMGGLMDGNLDTVPIYTMTEECNWRFKAAQCGSASGLPTCDKTFDNCQTRNATERFRGIPVAGMVTQIGGVLLGGGGGGHIGDGGGGPGDGGGGPVIRPNRD